MTDKPAYRPLIVAVVTADEISIDKRDSSLSAIIPFAESDDGKTIIAVECQANLISFEEQVFYEFCFYISVTPVDESSEEITDIWAPEAARQYIPLETKKLLLPIVGECYKAFIREIDKLPIYRVTYASNPSEEALQKHDFLTAIIENAGYVIEETGTDEIGREFWMMTPKV